MPFTTAENRQKMLKFLETGEMPEKVDVGDWCFVFYRDMVRQWKENPRWTTAHNIYKKMREQIAIMGMGLNRESPLNLDQTMAYELAWQVFFQLYVMPYELKKCEENGDVDPNQTYELKS